MTAPVVAACKGAAIPDVLAFAALLAGADSRPLQAVTVYPGQVPVGVGRADSEWVAHNRAEAQAILDGARAAMPGTGVARWTARAAESAPRGLHEVMEAAGPGVIAVLGSHDARGSRRTAPGSTAERLLTGAPGPVVLVPWDYEEFAAPAIRRIAVAFIDTPDGRAALSGARALAAELGARLTIVGVMPATAGPGLGEPRRYAEGVRDDFAGSIRAASAGEDVRLLEPPVVDALADLLPDEFDLLVCGSRGYGPARRVLLGGVSARVLRRARIPVMVVPRP